ncbi:hypothetical protein [Aliiglaciecola sp. LCG003]|uniref:hypothetical protein n=1 Tax=Aliiglaciecola sp. LCG003 TaxID=3053655 RepID=UPI002573CC5C|nr:hypothetical protein [Aliiglaciecola sp. LCG003]WJG10841.1 hypothetical protein QR722_07375 [Aliiglaciecola sp. LCG003]
MRTYTGFERLENVTGIRHGIFRWRKQLTLLCAALLVLSACSQVLNLDIVRFADTDTYIVPKTTLSTVDRTFYTAFSVGSWHYKGADAKFGEVNAYIQIPEKLDLASDVQQRYLQQVICPKADNIDLWHQLKNVDLQVHIYTSNKNKSISATCINPLQKNHMLAANA